MSEPQTPQEVYRALQRRARSEGRGVQELFEFYLLERFLYRLSISPYRDRFVLKGGLLLTILGARRPTRDADVLALSTVHPIQARTLRQALERTAAHRGTQLMPLSQALDTLPTTRQRDWRAFLDRSRLITMPDSFKEAVAEVENFVDPVLRNDPDLDLWNPSTGEWERRE